MTDDEADESPHTYTNYSWNREEERRQAAAFLAQHDNPTPAEVAQWVYGPTAMAAEGHEYLIERARVLLLPEDDPDRLAAELQDDLDEHEYVDAEGNRYLRHDWDRHDRDRHGEDE
jgi:hypothetical protein